MALTGKNNEEKIWNYLKAQGLTDCGVAGLMGNLYAESGLIPTNLQNSYEKKLGYTDATYTEAVDSGAYSNFVRDSAGYGLAQWTYWSRKQALLDYAKAAGKSVGDLETQLGFLMQELAGSFKAVLNTLKSATTVKTASNAVLLQFERPADQSASVQTKRAGYGQTYYDKYAAKDTEKEETAMSNSSLVSYTKLSPNHSGQRTHAIDRITPHCVVGQCSVETLGNIFQPTSKQASCNYGIGVDGRIGMYCEEKNRSWCSSSNENDQRAVTIECASDATAPYAFKDVVYQALIKLCVDICKRNGKKKLLWLGDKAKTLAYSPKSDEMILTVHRWFANKSCPGDWMYARMGDLASKVTAQLGGGTAANPSTPSTPGATTAAGDLKVGDIVEFTGDTHYTNSNAATGVKCKPGKAKVTVIAKGAKHPYHLVKEAGGGSTVYGWVDAADIATGGGEEVYTVVAGDTLWGIAQKKLGSGARWQEISKLNGLTSQTIVVGQKLKIPS